MTSDLGDLQRTGNVHVINGMVKIKIKIGVGCFVSAVVKS